MFIQPIQEFAHRPRGAEETIHSDRCTTVARGELFCEGWPITHVLRTPDGRILRVMSETDGTARTFDFLPEGEAFQICIMLQNAGYTVDLEKEFPEWSKKIEAM